MSKLNKVTYMHYIYIYVMVTIQKFKDMNCNIRNINYQDNKIFKD